MSGRRCGGERQLVRANAIEEPGILQTVKQEQVHKARQPDEDEQFRRLAGLCLPGHCQARTGGIEDQNGALDAEQAFEPGQFEMVEIRSRILQGCMEACDQAPGEQTVDGDAGQDPEGEHKDADRQDFKHQKGQDGRACMGQVGAAETCILQRKAARIEIHHRAVTKAQSNTQAGQVRALLGWADQIDPHMAAQHNEEEAEHLVGECAKAAAEGEIRHKQRRLHNDDDLYGAEHFFQNRPLVLTDETWIVCGSRRTGSRSQKF